jgi:predicted Zn-ribbon and HTH transcriptional regulator
LNPFRPLGGDTETISRSLVIYELDMQTRRERIAELLEETEIPLTAQDICNALDIKSRSVVYEDVEHISISVKNKGKHLLIRPASCGKCGYVFSKRKAAKRPSKCPKCRSEWILLPAYLIREKKR